MIGSSVQNLNRMGRSGCKTRSLTSGARTNTVLAGRGRRVNVDHVLSETTDHLVRWLLQLLLDLVLHLHHDVVSPVI